MNIIWKMPDGCVAVTHVIDPDTNLNDHAAELQERGDIPSDWEKVSTNVSMPADKLFRGAWSWTTTKKSIDINMTKAKEVAHKYRRDKREIEFKPLDEIIAKNIPGTDLVATENARQDVRDKYSLIQSDIDSATTESNLRQKMAETGIL